MAARALAFFFLAAAGVNDACYTDSSKSFAMGDKTSVVFSTSALPPRQGLRSHLFLV